MTVTLMKKNKKIKTRVGIFKNMGGNIPGGNFPGGEFDGWEFSGWEFSWHHLYLCLGLGLFMS